MSRRSIGRRSKAGVLALGAATLVAAGVGGVATAAPSFAWGSPPPTCGPNQLIVPGGGGYPTAQPNTTLATYLVGQAQGPRIRYRWGHQGAWQYAPVGQMQPQFQPQGPFQVLGQQVVCQMPPQSPPPMQPVPIPVPPTVVGYQLLSVQIQTVSFFTTIQTTVNCTPPPPVTTPVYPAIGGGLFAVISGAGLFWLQRRRRSARFSTPALGV